MTTDDTLREPGGRFGLDADAPWKGFVGGFKTGDRIDALLHDTDAAWPRGRLVPGRPSVYGRVPGDDAFEADEASLKTMGSKNTNSGSR